MDIILETELEIVKDYNNGIAKTALCIKYKIADERIRKILLKHNVKIRNLSESHTIYKFDINFFKKIDSEEKAYFLGFLYADGNIHGNMMQLVLHPKDENILIKFKDIIKYEGEIRNDRGYRRLNICNAELSSDLIKLGCIPQKTFKLKFPTPEQVPNHLIRHFMRGYFDGDGCITYHFKKNTEKVIQWKVDVISCFDFITEYKNNFTKFTNIDKVYLRKEPRREKPIYIMTTMAQTNKRLLKIFDFFYKDATVFLERKRNKFIEINKQLMENFEYRNLYGNCNNLGSLKIE